MPAQKLLRLLWFLRDNLIFILLMVPILFFGIVGSLPLEIVLASVTAWLKMEHRLVVFFCGALWTILSMLGFAIPAYLILQYKGGRGFLRRWRLTRSLLQELERD
jgi:hypothetical protein